MENILKVVRKDGLTNEYFTVEYCGSIDSTLEGYYFVISKEDKGKLMELLGAETEAEKIDIEQRIVSNQIKDFILDYLDSEYDSLTGHYMSVYGGVDEFLIHYGYLESDEDPDSFYSEAMFNEFNNDEVIDEPKYEVHMFDEEPIEEEVEEEVIDEVMPEPVVSSPSFTEDRPVIFADKESEIASEMLKIIIEDLHLDYNKIRRKAENRIEAKLNPVLTEEEVSLTLDELISMGIYTETDKRLILLTYKSGNELEVTNLLGDKCNEVKQRGF